ncbi:MAG TPA: GGDEF domain-containing protein [Burkholderiaceae bacterium]
MSIPLPPIDPPRALDAPARGADAAGPARWLFGDVPERRGPLTLTLLAVLVYALFALVTAWQVVLGLMTFGDWVEWTSVSLIGILGFYVLIRSGISRRLGSDPSLTLAQTAFGTASTVFGYAIDPPLRGAIIAIMMLNLVWGMFVLKQRQAQGLCVYALALLGATMVWKSTTQPALFPPHIEVLHFAFAAILLTATSVLSIRMGDLRMRLAARKAELQDALATIKALAQVDELTRLSNRRHVFELLKAEQARCMRSSDPLSVVLVDLDHFKAINDRHGHAVGDAVLRGFAQALREGLRETDGAGRWGGEEFLLVLPGMPTRAAAALVDRLRGVVSERLLDPTVPELRLSFSAGVSECGGGEVVQDAIARADDALYAAKNAGRGRTMVHGRDGA